MSFTTLAVRALVAYVWLLVLVRLDGKRGIAEASAFDFVLAVVLGDMVDDLLWSEVPPTVFLAGTGVLVLTHFSVSVAAFLSDGIARLVHGEPVPLVTRGRFDRPGMRRERMRREDVLAALRRHGMRDARAVRRASVEESGGTAVLPEDWARDADGRDLGRLPPVVATDR